MSLLIYQVPISWVPSSVYINANKSLHYIAWQIGRSENLGLAAWLIAPVVDAPVALSTLLPVGWSSFSFDDDVSKNGFQRSVLNKSSIDDVQARFLAEVATTAAAVADGSRA